MYLKKTTDMENNIHYRLLSIEDGVYTDKSGTEDTAELSAQNLGFQYRLTTNLNMRDNTITVSPQIRYVFRDRELLEAGVAYCFGISDLNAIANIDSEGKKVRLDTVFISTLVGIAFSGLRGVVYEKTKGGPLEAYPVPVVTMDALLKNNAVRIV